jgi:hypothetical protein
MSHFPQKASKRREKSEINIEMTGFHMVWGTGNYFAVCAASLDAVI